MYNIALICQNGASTGLCMRKMIEYAKNNGIECEIGAFPDSELPNLIQKMDCVLLGPQIAFKLAGFKAAYPDQSGKLSVIAPMDFGMMDGKKILTDAIKIIEQN